MHASSRSLRGLSGLIFFIPLGLNPFLAIFLKSFLLWGTDRVGIALGVLDLTVALFQVPCGLLIDAVKFKRFLLYGACSAVALACLFIINTTTSIVPVVFAQVLVGISMAIAPLCIAAVTLGLVGRRAFPKRVSINQTVIHLGNVTTAGLIGVVAYFFGHHWIFYMVILYALLAMCYLAWINPQEINHNIARELYQRPTSKKHILRDKRVVIFCISVFLFHFANGAQLPLLGQFLASKDSTMDAVFIGICIILAQLFMIPTAYSTGFLMKRMGRKPIFLAALCVLPLRAFLYALADHPTLLLSIQVLDGIATGIFGVIGIVIIDDLVTHTGRFNFSLGLMTLAQSLGSSSSNILSGFMAKLFGFHIGFSVLGVIGLIGIAFFASLMPETKHQR